MYICLYIKRKRERKREVFLRLLLERAAPVRRSPRRTRVCRSRAEGESAHQYSFSSIMKRFVLLIASYRSPSLVSCHDAHMMLHCSFMPKKEILAAVW